MEKLAPEWLAGCKLRQCYFEPTFHKHQGALCAGFQIHTDHPGYNHQLFRPYRLMALFLKALRYCQPGYEIWRDFPYEYVDSRLPIDTISGSELLRTWVDDPAAPVEELENTLIKDERTWQDDTASYYLY